MYGTPSSLSGSIVLSCRTTICSGLQRSIKTFINWRENFQVQGQKGNSKFQFANPGMVLCARCCAYLDRQSRRSTVLNCTVLCITNGNLNQISAIGGLMVHGTVHSTISQFASNSLQNYYSYKQTVKTTDDSPRAKGNKQALDRYRNQIP